MLTIQLQFAKLARSLEIPGGMRVGKASEDSSTPQLTATSGATGEPPDARAPTQLDDEELEGGLC